MILKQRLTKFILNLRYFPGMLEVGTLITGVITGPIIGLFMVGMLLPMVTNGGAVTSFIGSILLTRWLCN